MPAVLGWDEERSAGGVAARYGLGSTTKGRLITELGRVTAEALQDQPDLSKALKKRWMRVIGDHCGESD